MNKLLKYLSIFVFLISLNPLIAQDYGNEWIDYDQQYFKIHISEDGLYKVTYSELLAAGVPVNVIDPRGIQVYYKGEEQYIYIQGEGTSGIFDPAGYIEFYGLRNRGNQDELFFDSPSNRVNDDYSFYNDTSAYFLTWNFTTSNSRISSLNQTDYSPYVSGAQDFCVKNIRNNYTLSYYWGSTKSFFTEGEGWFDNAIITDEISRTKTLSLSQVYSTSANASIEIAVVGAPSNQPSSTVL
jgi:hypothetical protein